MMGRGEKGKPEAGFRMYEVQFSSVQRERCYNSVHFKAVFYLPCG